MQLLAEQKLEDQHADPTADKYEMTTVATRYSGATIARSSAINVRRTTSRVTAMMNLMSCW